MQPLSQNDGEIDDGKKSGVISGFLMADGGSSSDVEPVDEESEAEFTAWTWSMHGI